MRVIFVCDGTLATGLGHVSRCLGFAEALIERDVDVAFVGTFEPPAFSLLNAARVSVLKASRADASAFAQINDGIVVDSYETTENFLAELNLLTPVLAIDDFGRLSNYPCAAILNFTVEAGMLPYPGTPLVRLLGPRYTLLRRSLRALRRQARPLRDFGRNVLLSFGGGAWEAAARQALDALARVRLDLRVHLVVGRGSADPVADKLAAFMAARFSSGLPDLAEAFSEADLCITGGGLTKYEAAYLGLPAAVFSQTPDEAAETARFAAHGLAIDMAGDDPTAALSRLINDREQRNALRDTAMALFPEDPTALAADSYCQLLKEIGHG